MDHISATAADIDSLTWSTKESNSARSAAFWAAVITPAFATFGTAGAFPKLNFFGSGAAATGLPFAVLAGLVGLVDSLTGANFVGASMTRMSIPFSARTSSIENPLFPFDFDIVTSPPYWARKPPDTDPPPGNIPRD